MPLVYAELHRLADRQLRTERRGHSFRPTDLVSEAYLRFYAGQLPSCTDRSHFFALAARTMRQVLIDHARARLAVKRGGTEPRERVELDALGVDGQSLDVLAVDEALRALAELDERKARIVELHYFSGLTHEEIAELFELHVNTVARDLRLASAWLHRTLQ
jgi:RNA polymerase sigma factor (TIGR02999 family)